MFLPVAGDDGPHAIPINPPIGTGMENPLPTFPIAPLGSEISDTAVAMAADRNVPPVPDPTALTAQLEGMLGLATLPPKLMKRILNREYVDMFEILPESWRIEADTASQAGQGKRPRRGPITNIDVWCECYSVLAAVLSAAYPVKAPHFFAYMRTIVRASRNFEGTAWVSYDVSFRRAAANKRSLDWGLPDPGRFNDAFVGRSKVIPRCTYCLSDTHTADDCPDAPSQRQPPLSHRSTPPKPDCPIREAGLLIQSRSVACLIMHQAPAAASRAAVLPISVTDVTAHTLPQTAEKGIRAACARDPR